MLREAVVFFLEMMQGKNDLFTHFLMTSCAKLTFNTHAVMKQHGPIPERSASIPLHLHSRVSVEFMKTKMQDCTDENFRFFMSELEQRYSNTSSWVNLGKFPMELATGCERSSSTTSSSTSLLDSDLCEVLTDVQNKGDEHVGGNIRYLRQDIDLQVCEKGVLHTFLLLDDQKAESGKPSQKRATDNEAASESAKRRKGDAGMADTAALLIRIHNLEEEYRGETSRAASTFWGEYIAGLSTVVCYFRSSC